MTELQRQDQGREIRLAWPEPNGSGQVANCVLFAYLDLATDFFIELITDTLNIFQIFG